MGSCVVKGRKEGNYETVEVNNSVVGKFIKCVPSYRYRRYPRTLTKPAFSLLVEKSVFPSTPDETYYAEYHYWTDVQFLPNDDTFLFVSGTASEIPQTYGRIKAISVDKDNKAEQILEATGIPLYNKFHAHPSGRCLGYVNFPQDLWNLRTTFGTCMLSIQKPIFYQDSKAKIYTRPDVQEKQKDTYFTEICRVMAFAPDGKQLAKIVTRQPRLEEETSCFACRKSQRNPWLKDETSRFACRKSERIDSFLYDQRIKWSLVLMELGASTVRSVALDDKFLFQQMLPSRSVLSSKAKVMECKWTPDSKHIAVCCAKDLYIFNRKLEQVFDISETLPHPYSDMDGGYIIHLGCTTSKWDFDPTSCHEMLVFGTVDRRVYSINTSTKQIDAQTPQLASTKNDFIDCIQYHPFGKYVVVGIRSFTLYVVNSKNGTVLYSFDMRTECPNLRQRSDEFPSIHRIAFSATGDQLVTATSDAKVRVFQMPVEISLFDKCKWVILSVVPQANLQRLPLPNPLINKLLAIPVMK